MVFVTCAPDTLYFHWQTEVYLTNFLSMGIPKDKIHVVYLAKDKPSLGLLKIMNKYPVKWFIYKVDSFERYPSTNWFKGLKHHSINLTERVFYHDSDIIFLKPPDIKKLDSLPYDKWYASDTRSYTDSKYIKSKSELAFTKMCKIVGVTPGFVEMRDKSAGGAQWIHDPMDYAFWDKCERDALNLWMYLEKYNNENPKEKHIQKTAAMWSILWNSWKAGKETEIKDELSFTFSSSLLKKCDEVNILHNAGVVDRNDPLKFAKIAWYKESPLGKNFDHYSEKFSAFRYVQELNKVNLNNGNGTI